MVMLMFCRLCTIRTVDGTAITSFLVHECEGSNRMGSRPRRFLFTGTSGGSIQQHYEKRLEFILSRDLRTSFTGVTEQLGGIQLFLLISQMWDLTTALDQYHANLVSPSLTLSTQGNVAEKPTSAATAGASSAATASNANAMLLAHRSHAAVRQGPTADELLNLIDGCEICCASLNTTPSSTPHASSIHLPGLDYQRPY
ncbi:unnamed protein product [Gongylonema pulchrum]|uniref:Uncharacterized protein n=1 Tax=Gongylonema pulchrum TaxID=637853 RepID=A0A183DQQ5_9BILA|nr:unnamed protein product [Gongylonema pulchrum]